MPGEKAKPTLNEVLIEAIDTLTKFSVPLYVDDDRARPVQFGTGFFVHVERHYFLVSAAHVLRAVRTRRVYYYFTPTMHRALTGKVLATSLPQDTANDPLDVAVMKFTGEAMPPYPEVQKFPMGIDYLKGQHQPRSNKHYVIIGFPASKAEVDNITRTTLSKPYAYRSDSIDDAEYLRHGCDPATHVILPLDRRKSFDMNGNRINELPQPQGMSGSPITVLYDIEEEREGSSRVFPVVAVGIEYRKAQKVLIGTDVRYVLEMIYQHLRG